MFVWAYAVLIVATIVALTMLAIGFNKEDKRMIDQLQHSLRVARQRHAQDETDAQYQAHLLHLEEVEVANLRTLIDSLELRITGYELDMAGTLRALEVARGHVQLARYEGFDEALMIFYPGDEGIPTRVRKLRQWLDAREPGFSSTAEWQTLELELYGYVSI